MSIHASALAAPGPLASNIKPSAVSGALYEYAQVNLTIEIGSLVPSLELLVAHQLPSRAWKGCNSPDRSMVGGWRSIRNQDIARVGYSVGQMGFATTTAIVPQHVGGAVTNRYRWWC